MTNVVKFRPRQKKPEVKPTQQAQANNAATGTSPARLIVLAVCIAVVVAGIFAPAIFSMF